MENDQTLSSPLLQIDYLDRQQKERYQETIFELVNMGFQKGVCQRLFQVYPHVLEESNLDIRIERVILLIQNQDGTYLHDFIPVSLQHSSKKANYGESQQNICFICEDYDALHHNIQSQQTIRTLNYGNWRQPSIQSVDLGMNQNQINQSLTNRTTSNLYNQISNQQNSRSFLQRFQPSALSELKIDLEMDSCQICYAQTENKTSCDHRICSKCIFDYMSQQIEDGRALKIVCPYYGCNQQFSNQFIEQYIQKFQPNLMEKYKRFRLYNEIDEDPQAKWCPTPNCNGYVRFENIKQNEQKKRIFPKVNCSICQRDFCFKCGRSWHAKKSCEQVQERQFTSYAKKKDVRKCPECQANIEKNQGCNHMTCIRCNSQFCWLCMQKYTVQHYNKPWWLGGCSQFGSLGGWQRYGNCVKYLLVSLFILLSPIILVLMIIFGPAVSFLIKLVIILYEPLWERWHGLQRTCLKFLAFFAMLILTPILYLVLSIWCVLAIIIVLCMGLKMGFTIVYRCLRRSRNAD